MTTNHAHHSAQPGSPSTGDEAGEPNSPGGAVARHIRQRLEPRQEEMVALLGDLVGIESPSDDPPGLNAMADRLVELFGPFGNIERHRNEPDGTCNLVLGVGGADPNLPHVAVLGHFDTVWPRGTLARLPFHVDDGVRLTGPGCFDMKGGLVQLYYALRELREVGVTPRRPVRILFNCDEEVRSRTSRPLIRTLAEGAAAALVLEAPLPGGSLKTARKGTGTYELKITGRAAHAGIEPHKGASAIVELAHQVHALHALNDFERGTTVNVGVVAGGSRSNVVPASAEAHVDVRVTTMDEAHRIDRLINDLEPVIPGTTLTVIADARRPPMEPTAASRALFGRAQDIAVAMGLPGLGAGSTGGASDANLVAAMGVPTLDGLGPEGGGAHADDEHVLVESMPWRTALIAGLLTEI